MACGYGRYLFIKSWLIEAIPPRPSTRRQGSNPGWKVIDAGGAYCPWSAKVADAFVDLFPIEGRDVLIGDINEPQVREVIRRRNFDFCICRPTPEDVRNPPVILGRIQKLFRGGYIATPDKRVGVQPRRIQALDRLPPPSLDLHACRARAAHDCQVPARILLFAQTAMGRPADGERSYQAPRARRPRRHRLSAAVASRPCTAIKRTCFHPVGQSAVHGHQQ